MDYPREGTQHHPAFGFSLNPICSKLLVVMGAHENAIICIFFLRKDLFETSEGPFGGFGFGSSPCHIGLGAGAPPNGQSDGAASGVIVEELEPFFALHAGATNPSSVAPAPAPAPAPHEEPSVSSPPKRGLSCWVWLILADWKARS